MQERLVWCQIFSSYMATNMKLSTSCRKCPAWILVRTMTTHDLTLWFSSLSSEILGQSSTRSWLPHFKSFPIHYPPITLQIMLYMYNLKFRLYNELRKRTIKMECSSICAHACVFVCAHVCMYTHTLTCINLHAKSKYKYYFTLPIH